MKANGSQLARIFGVNRNTVAAWREAGCPVAARGRQGKEYEFDTAEVHGWLVSRAVADAVEIAERTDAPAGSAYDTARARKMAADAEVAELRADEIRGRVVVVDEVTRIVSDVFGAVRAKFLSLPTRLSVKFAAARSREEAKTLLTDGVNEVLAELVFDARRVRRATLADEDTDDVDAADMPDHGNKRHNNAADMP